MRDGERRSNVGFVSGPGSARASRASRKGRKQVSRGPQMTKKRNQIFPIISPNEKCHVRRAAPTFYFPFRHFPPLPLSLAISRLPSSTPRGDVSANRTAWSWADNAPFPTRKPPPGCGTCAAASCWASPYFGSRARGPAKGADIGQGRRPSELRY